MGGRGSTLTWWVRSVLIRRQYGACPCASVLTYFHMSMYLHVVINFFQVEKSSGVANECFSNMRTVRAFSMEGNILDSYRNQLGKARQLNTLLGLGIGVFQGLSNVAINTMALVVLYYGGSLVAAGQLTSGSLMNFLMSTQAIQRSLGQLSILFGNAVKGAGAAVRILDYIERQPRMKKSGQYVSENLEGNIVFRNVTFSYPTRPHQTVLNNFNLEIQAGTVVALVGPSGAGKTSVVSLIERFYQPQQGSVLLDNVNLDDMDDEWLRGQAIGYINQEPTLFAASVRENIRFGRPGSTDEEVEEAARLANAHQFISNFPDGYDTLVGERGVSVSGGQKQRIAIARALLKDPKILLLDEATSALDTQSERVVQEALDRVMVGRTTIVVAHRLSTVRHANKIVVVDEGRVVEEGTHEQLVARKGLYAELVSKQMSG